MKIWLMNHYASEDTCGINVVMKRDIEKSEFFQGKLKEGEFFDFSTPYGYGGWIVEGKGIGELFREYQEWIKENRIVSEFVRFHPLLENHLPMEDCFEVHKLGEVVYMDLSPPDIIWSNLSSKNRNMIRKASKNDIKIYNGRSPEIYRKWETKLPFVGKLKGIYNLLFFHFIEQNRNN